jgi:hypothetical protein
MVINRVDENGKRSERRERVHYAALHSRARGFHLGEFRFHLSEKLCYKIR